MSVPDWMIDTPAVNVDDLAHLVKKLAHALRKAAPSHALPDQAVDYLRRHNLQGSILRAAPAGAAGQDAVRLDALRENSWGLRCIEVPTGQGDGDVHWCVIEHHMAKPYEREVGRCFTDEPRDAIDAALAAQGDGEPS